ncbi:hypothetical protein TREMEDRAFT_59912 [Tremella mesenterica DSM 1558]|uniref:uncharacterized protein n=1 Tax=Tremella mesenterica (strain ATCC 24925 / CBS 8224 / DSM 1558 / NBRC 9311 / NRRL Y-6157 / RJB 2259-6 / UBC 559-6) TaxID=578456 RepID=UPI0003F4929A|nr:uncharacterized protein TREMEDRAFT_59912 [Tremella mesenterica DSM 1558]EIW70977.1 hypothetical protein TREMEDRAFT_59912 [Tremella mesenterica DSM 1558]
MSGLYVTGSSILQETKWCIESNKSAPPETSTIQKRRKAKPPTKGVVLVVCAEIVPRNSYQVSDAQDSNTVTIPYPNQVVVPGIFKAWERLYPKMSEAERQIALTLLANQSVPDSQAESARKITSKLYKSLFKPLVDNFPELKMAGVKEDVCWVGIEDYYSLLTQVPSDGLRTKEGLRDVDSCVAMYSDISKR